MTNAVEEAKRAAEAGAAEDRFSSLIDALGGTASAQAVFGAPIEKDGITVVPVARVRYIAGGGRGPARKKGDHGEGDQVGIGQAGAVQVSPVGHIELCDGKATYRRIDDPVRPLAVLLLVPLVGALSFAVTALVAGQVAKSVSTSLPLPLQLPRPRLPWRS